MISEEVAGRAAAHGGAAAFAHVTREHSLMLRFAAGRPTQSTAIDDLTIEIAVPFRGQVGRASTNAVDERALADCAGRARLAAEAAAALGDGAFPGFAPDAVASAGADGRGFDSLTAELDPEAGGAALAEAFAVAADQGLEAHGIWTVAEQEEAWATAGGSGAERRTDAFMKVICIAPSGRSGYASQTSVAVADIHARELAERAAEKAVVPGEPARLGPGEYPVVFEPHAVGWLLDLLSGCAFNGLAHAEGRGALDGRLGQRVAVPLVNLSDSPRAARTLPRSFDAEGTRKAPMPLIQDGVAHGVAHDRRSAALAGAASTGHALAPGGTPAGPSPTNLVLAGGGATSEAELCAPVERGVYVTRLWYANVVRPKETLITAVTRDGTFLIEDGRVARPLHDLRLTDSVLGILSRTQSLGRHQRLTSDGEFYGRRFAYGVVCPALRADAVRFTGGAA
ncbi:MAG TPA: metallopeptidase TldD-related protein [Thermoleophilaceae bacterium]|nr:metallopeptidase TldD-related protein [Thermoleophilaceae bacterium]